MKGKPAGTTIAVVDDAPSALSPRRQRRATEILAAAREVFLEKGFERTAVSEVANRVGIVEGLVFSYFASKRELLHEVLGALYEPLIRDVETGYARLKGLRARLRFIVWRHIRVYVESPGMARLVLHEVRTGPEYASSGLYALHVRYTRFVRLALDQAVADGELDGPVDVETTRALLYGGLEHLLWPVLHGEAAIDVDRVADHYIDQLLHGLQGLRERDTMDARLSRLETLIVASAPVRRRGAAR